MTCAGNVNSQFELGDLSVDMFKCLIFVQGLTAVKNKYIRSRILTMIEQNPKVTLQKLSGECHKLINEKRDNTRIEEKNILRAQAIKQTKFTKNKAKICDS